MLSIEIWKIGDAKILGKLGGWEVQKHGTKF